MDHQSGCQDYLFIYSVNTFILLVRQKRKKQEKENVYFAK